MHSQHNADEVAKTLLEVDPLPKGTEDAVAGAIENTTKDANVPFVYDLLRLARRVGGQKVLRGVARLATTNENTHVRVVAIRQLQAGSDTEVTKVLLTLMASTVASVSRAATISLAKAGRTEAIPTLLSFAAKSNPLGDDDDEMIDDVYAALANFPNDPRVLPALQAGRHSINPIVHEQAELAVTSIKNSQQVVDH